MAASDVLGICSLLLATGGAVYLFRSRLFGRAPEQPSAAPPAESDARSTSTMPPALCPAADQPAAPKQKARRAEPRKTLADSPVGKAKSDPLITVGKAVPPETSKKAETSEKASEAAVTTPAPPLPPSRPPPSLDVKITPPPVTVPDGARAAARKKSGEPPSDTPARLPVLDLPRLETDEDDDVEATRFGRHERPSSIRPPVERHVYDEGAEAPELTPEETAGPLVVLFAHAQTDPGRRRKQNEDSFLLDKAHDVFVVADGMGGHRGGEHASRIAVETIGRAFETSTFEAEAHADLPVAASELARAIQMANAAILHEASQKAELKGMGTTLCAARFTSDKRRLYLGHVGDSRCYRVRDGVMKQMTNDHTMADFGVAGPEGAHLSRALGVWPTVPIDIIMARPVLGDLYLLCSDGLTKMLTNETIATQLLHEEDPKAAVERLVLFANAHGGKDNITVILLRVIEPGWSPPSAGDPRAAAEG